VITVVKVLLYFAALGVVALGFWQFGPTFLRQAGLFRTSTTVEVPGEEPRTYRIVTVLSKDGIPAILDPTLVSAQEVGTDLRDNELVLALSLNGDSRAYPISTLSRHEIVNDVVGGVPVAVTW
jgi:hypothetical protein